MSNRAQYRVSKHLRITKPFGSQAMADLFAPVLAEIKKLRRGGKVGVEPDHLFLALDAFGKNECVPAAVYDSYLLAFDKDDRRQIDRMLQTSGLLEPSVVFGDDKVLDLGFTPGVHYTNQNLVSEIFKPRTAWAIELAEIAVYALRVPGEKLYDMFCVPRSIRSVLARVLQLAGGKADARGVKTDEEECLALYRKRATDQKMRDARTMAGLIVAYAADEYPEVQTRAKELAINFALLFNGPQDVEALVILKDCLRATAFSAGGRVVPELLEQVERGIEYRKSRQRGASVEHDKWKRIITDRRSLSTRNRTR